MAQCWGQGGQKYRSGMKIPCPTSFWCYCTYEPKWNAGNVYCHRSEEKSSWVGIVSNWFLHACLPFPIATGWSFGALENITIVFVIIFIVLVDTLIFVVTIIVLFFFCNFNNSSNISFLAKQATNTYSFAWLTDQAGILPFLLYFTLYGLLQQNGPLY